MGGGAIAGGGVGALVLAAIGYFVFGIDPQTTTQLASQFGGVGAAEQGKMGSPEDQAGAFVDRAAHLRLEVVLAGKALLQSLRIVAEIRRHRPSKIGSGRQTICGSLECAP